jgi:phage repressor protein C with HTH and peptisase S24 domain
MLSHEGIWAAIDALAERKGLSPSGLAKLAGLDPTSFNKSKRATSAGRARWPSTESIAKALRATSTPMEEFLELIPGELIPSRKSARRGGKAATARGSLSPRSPETVRYGGPMQVPVIGLAQAGVGGFFDDGGFPSGQGWDEIQFPSSPREAVYALEVSGDSMLPLYRDGDVVIVAPGAAVRAGDRVVLRTRGGEVMAKILAKRTAKEVVVRSFNPEHDDRTIPSAQIDWLARIVWASQ